jgi:PAS domain S-box-containing protein
MDMLLILPAITLGLFYFYTKRLLKQLSGIAQLAVSSLVVLSLSGLFFHLILPPEDPWRAVLIYGRDYGTSLLLVSLIFWIAHSYRKHGDLHALLSKQQAELQQQQSLLDTVIEAVPMPIAWRDHNGVFLGCNHIYADHIGITRCLMLGQTLGSLLVNPEKRKRLREHAEKDREAMRTGHVRYEFEEFGKTFIYHKKAIKDGTKVTGVVSVIYDATEVINSRKLLQKQDAINQAFLDLTDDIIIILDKSLVVHFVNPSIGHVSTLSPAFATGKFLSFLENECGFFAQIAAQIRLTFREEESTRAQITCNAPICRSEQWMDVQCSPVYLEDNPNLEYVFCSIRDVSKLMRAQKQLAYMNEMIMKSAEMGMEAHALRTGRHGGS